MSTNSTETNASADAAPQANTGLFLMGALGAAVAAIASILLAWQHITGLAIPGCGPDSGCGALAASIWGKVPGLGWPVSFIGAAYFIGVAIAWVVARGRLHGPMRWIVRVGALASIGFLIVMFLVEKHFCQYCFIAHLGNFVFVAAAELALLGKPTAGLNWRLPTGVTTAGFVLALGGLLIANSVAANRQTERDEEALDKSIQTAIDQTEAPRFNTDSVYGPDNPFTGRWLLGNEESPIRIVMFFDYQCVDCNRLEGEIMQVVTSRDDVSLSVKHFPMSSRCNTHVGVDKHPNACWAARAAEAAGIMYGNEEFWRMHEWLFSRPNPGSFTDTELDEGLAELGYDRDEFIRLMTSDETLANVESDIEEAIGLGLHFTPMIFINGVELFGWNAKDSVKRAVEALAARNPEPRTAAVDMPPPAIGKYISDWQKQPARPVPADASPHVVGPANAARKIIVWMDYEHSASVQFNDALSDLMRQRSDLSIDVRHYPVDQSCNPMSTRTAHPNACSMHRAVEAAHILGGDQAFWQMHNWVINNQKNFTTTTLMQAAANMGLDGGKLIQTMGSQEVTNRIEEDCRSAKKIGLRSVPWTLIDGKYLPRWRLNQTPIIDVVLDSSDPK